MLSFHVFLVILLSKLALSQRLVIPSSIQSCQPTTITWDPEAPNTGDGHHNISDLEVSFTAVLPNGTPYTLAFTNISSAGFSFVPIFHPGSQINVTQEFSDSSLIDSRQITVKDSGSDDCLFQLPTFSPDPAPVNSSAPFQYEPTPSMESLIPQCQAANLSWSGGVGPYHVLIPGNPATSPLALMAIQNITGSWVEMTFPLWTSSGDYELFVNDSSQHPVVLVGIGIAPSTESTKDCLIHPTDLSTLPNMPPPPASGSPTPSASDSNNQTNNKRQTIIIAVSVTLGVLFCLLLAAFTFRQLKIKRRQRKLRIIQNRFGNRQNDVRLESLKSPQEPAKM